MAAAVPARTEFIAEVSSNHNGDLQRCLRMISAAAACGCTGVKFQLFRIDRLFAREILQVSPMHRNRRRWELPVHFLPELTAHARDLDLRFGCTALPSPGLGASRTAACSGTRVA